MYNGCIFIFLVISIQLTTNTEEGCYRYHSTGCLIIYNAPKYLLPLVKR